MKSVVLAGAQRDDQYGNDPYIVRRQPRSLMSMPLLNQSRLAGVLYLENNKVGAFTPERLLICQMLAAGRKNIAFHYGGHGGVDRR